MIDSERHRARVGIQSLGAAERDRRRAEPCETGASHFKIEVLFKKSRTLKPDENRAERAVGNTWFEPPT